jgi:hypothetical protein
MYKIGKVVLSRDVKSQKNSLFCTSKKEKLMRKKTYFIGVTHEIGRIRNYSSWIFD